MKRWSLWSIVALAGLAAAVGCKGGGKSAGGEVIVAGFDDMPDTLAAIKDGTVQFCIAQRTYKMGWLSVEKLLDALEGKPVPKEIDTGVLIVTKGNADTYMKDMKQEFQGGKSVAAKGKERLLVMVPKGVHPYYEPCYEGFKDAAARYGVKTEYRAAKVFEVPQQVEVIENLIARKVDGIAISALDDEGLVSVIQDATNAGIKVITFDAPAPSSRAITYIGTMNEAAGRTGAEELIKLMGGEGEVAVLQGGLGAPNLNDRFKGFQKTLQEKAPKIKIVTREDVQGKFDVAVNKTEALLQTYPNLKAIFCVSAEGAPAAATVIKRQRPGKGAAAQPASKG
jgi:ABC-type sugar transport system substrate-binding protein